MNWELVEKLRPEFDESYDEHIGKGLRDGAYVEYRRIWNRIEQEKRNRGNKDKSYKRNRRWRRKMEPLDKEEYERKAELKGILEGVE